jgi:hypothetical protein
MVQSRFAGIVVHPPGRCSCSTELAVIDDTGTILRCSTCLALRGRLSQPTCDFITETIRLFGTPTTPITIRRGGQL